MGHGSRRTVLGGIARIRLLLTASVIAALREIVRRFLHTYGPATREEFARWWGMQPAPAGRILRASAQDLAEVDVEGRRLGST